ncbi:MAG: hypothetical protein KVP17_004063 [Porospora cf. gigantea B]|uniref:uncharacterized protein n=1 Tax=Porospora cf. gigantea B TaxID=2853592 RepID=UPI00357190A3|nr:MAG: hypothetical protein KVP17_004063 [Porospora cf. gigantea B]
MTSPLIRRISGFRVSYWREQTFPSVTEGQVSARGRHAAYPAAPELRSHDDVSGYRETDRKFLERLYRMESFWLQEERLPVESFWL